MRIPDSIFPLPQPPETKTVSLTGKKDLAAEKKKLYATTKELESMFLYHVLKAMRSTIPESGAKNDLAFGGGMGKDIFTQIFDQELAKKMSGNGERSLAEILYKRLEKLIERQNAPEEPPSGKNNFSLDQIKPDSPPIPLDSESNIPTNPAEILPFRPIYDPLKILPAETIQKSAENPSVNEASINKVKADTVVPKPETPLEPAEDELMGRFGELITRVSNKYQLDPHLVTAVIKAESGGDPEAVSPAGAKGLMQLVDTTAADMGVTDIFDPEDNIEGGARYLRILLDTFGDLKHALAAYNSGPATVKKYGGIPPYRETKNYVARVMQVLKDVSGLPQ